MANIMKKLIEITILFVVDGIELIEDQNFACFDYWMKNKAHNGVSNLKQVVDSVDSVCLCPKA